MALVDLEEALRLSQEDGDAYLIRGIVYYDLGNDAAAIADLEQALLLLEDPDRRAAAEQILAELRAP